MRFFSFRILPREECAMTDEELRKLKRADLLELLVTQGKENEALQEKLRQAEAALWDRQIQLDEAGNIDLDRLYNAARPRFEGQKLPVTVPIIGELRFDVSDLDKLYRYIQEA